MLLTFLAFIIVLGVVVFVHEMGHFLAAKAVGARVEAFSLGFGKILGFKKGDTEYRLGYIPLGGYVKIAGMVDEFGTDEVTGAPDEFQSKNSWQKAFMITAGVIMNFLLGFLLYSLLAGIQGEAVVDPSAKIGSVAQDYPAMQAGIQPGDEIIAVNDQPVEEWDDFREAVHSRPNELISVTWVSGGDTSTSTLTTRAQEILAEDGIREVGMVGVGPVYNREPVGFFQAFKIGGEMTAGVLGLSLKSLQMLFTGDASVGDLTGPAGIVYLSGETARAGWESFIGFIALISISIGLLNILPFPVLDGGHLVYIIIEGVTKKTIPTRVKLVLQNVGMALLLLLVLVVTYHDIFRFFVN